MRGTLLIGMVVVLLIIGYLVMKNMGADNSSAVQETQTEAYMEKAKSAADDVNKRFKNISERADGSD